MSGFVQHFDPLKLQRVGDALQVLRDNTAILDRNRHRFSETPPPYESPPVTEPPSPTGYLGDLSEQEREERLRRPFDLGELYQWRLWTHAYRPLHRHRVEVELEQENIRKAYFARDENHYPTYCGPELSNSSGNDRHEVMVRNGIRKRWERLGVWNSAWGIPSRLDRPSEKENEPEEWVWEWAEPNIFTVKDGPTWEEQIAWPSAEEETASERAIRRFLQENGRWDDKIRICQKEPQSAGKIQIDPRESFVVSRPWFQYQLEIDEESQRLQRVQIEGRYETAVTNTKARWKNDGRWKETWQDVPGWKWRHESPSPEPEDPNHMDFSPSEIDMLEAVPPLSPAPERPIFPPIIHAPDLGRYWTPSQVRKILGGAREGEPTAMRKDHVDWLADGPRPVSVFPLFGIPSAKRQREAEGNVQADNAVSKPAKRVKLAKQVLKSKGPSGPTIKAKSQPKRKGNSRGSRSESKNTTDLALGTMWLDDAPPKPRPFVSKTTGAGTHTRGIPPAKLRRSARLVEKQITETNDDELHGPRTNQQRVHKSGTTSRTPKKASKPSKKPGPPEKSQPSVPAKQSKQQKPSRPPRPIKQKQPGKPPKTLGSTRKGTRKPVEPVIEVKNSAKAGRRARR